MRLLHPYTIKVIATQMTDNDFSKATVSRRSALSHGWSEVLKFMATKQSHPKMFIDSARTLGMYMAYIKHYGDQIGCVMNAQHLTKYDDLYDGFVFWEKEDGMFPLLEYFDKEYLFSDAISLYFKGVNIMPYLYGSEWRRLVPIESLDEIYRVVGKTIEKRKEK